MYVDNLKATRKIMELEYIAQNRQKKIKGNKHPTEGNKEGRKRTKEKHEKLKYQK